MQKIKMKAKLSASEIAEAEARMDPSAVLEMIHEFFLDNRVMNMTYSKGTHGGHIALCGPAEDESTPPIKVAIIDVQNGWGSNLISGKYYIRIHSAMLKRIESARQYAESTIAVPTVEAYLSLEDPKVFETTLGLLEKITVEYNKTIKNWNEVDNFLFSAHLVWDGLIMNELKLRR